MLQTHNTLRPRKNGRHLADDTFKHIFLNENIRISIKISLKFVPQGPINNSPAMVQIMAWHRPGDKPLSEPMMVRLPMHICVVRPQWVKSHYMYISIMLYSHYMIQCWPRSIWCHTVSFGHNELILTFSNGLIRFQQALSRNECNSLQPSDTIRSRGSWSTLPDSTKPLLEPNELLSFGLPDCPEPTFQRYKTFHLKNAFQHNVFKVAAFLCWPHCDNKSFGIVIPLDLTHWGWVIHMCRWTRPSLIQIPGNGLLPDQSQAIIWTNAGVLLFGPSGRNIS